MQHHISGTAGGSWRVLITTLSLLAISVGTSGCTTLQPLLDKQTQSVTGAAPLIDKPSPNTKAQLLDSIAESYQKCGAYKRTLLFGSRASNFGFDVLTTSFSALATAFKPVATIHALTAAATITSGSKTALDADVYMNATAPLMAEALSQAYDDKMQALHDALVADQDTDNLHEDFSEIERIHEGCSLSQALVELQTLQSKAASTPGGAVTQAAVVPNAVFMLANGSQVAITATTGTTPATQTAFNLQDASGVSVSYGPMATAQVLNLLNAAGAKLKSLPSK